MEEEKKRTDYTPFQKLDDVLRTLNHADYYWSAIDDIINDVYFKTDEREIRLITTRLLADKLIQSVPVDPNEEETYTAKYIPNLLYYTTFDGSCFEGYVNQKNRLASEKKQVQTIAIWQLIMTILLAIGSLGLLVIEILKYYTDC